MFSFGGMGSTSATPHKFDVTFGTISRLPPMPGYDPNGIHTAGLSTPFNYCSMTYINWFMNSFVGLRGSINLHMNVINIESYSQLSVHRTTGATRSAASYRTSTSYDGLFTGLPQFFVGTVGDTGGGVALTNTRTQAGLSAQLPMYSRFRMESTDPANIVEGTSLDDSQWNTFKYIAMTGGRSTTPDSGGVTFYFGAGTDFTLLGYMNVPDFYQYDAIPLPP
jgi:hypothetical protein